MSYPEQQMQQHVEAGISAAEQCYTRIAELEEQNAALQAELNQKQSLIDDMRELCLTSGEVNEIKAQAGLDGFFRCLDHLRMFDIEDGEYYAEDYAAAHQYAETIRQGGKS